MSSQTLNKQEVEKVERIVKNLGTLNKKLLS